MKWSAFSEWFSDGQLLWVRRSNRPELERTAERIAEGIGFLVDKFRMATCLEWVL
jgi:hypothetical protein